MTMILNGWIQITTKYFQNLLHNEYLQLIQIDIYKVACSGRAEWRALVIVGGAKQYTVKEKNSIMLGFTESFNFVTILK